jgi:outer membrane cobalamin receptor
LVWSSGVETSIGYQIPTIQSDVQISYSYKRVLDKRPDSPTFNTLLPYTPRHTISFSMITDFTSHAFGILVTGIGERFGLLGEIPESRVNPILLVNPFIEYRKTMFLGTFKLRAEIRNLLNSSYQMILNFPLPGRSFSFQCGITF